MSFNDFSVKLPLEDFEDWIKEQGISDGAILSHQDVNVSNVEIEKKDSYLLVEGTIDTRLDS